MNRDESIFQADDPIQDKVMRLLRAPAASHERRMENLAEAQILATFDLVRAVWLLKEAL